MKDLTERINLAVAAVIFPGASSVVSVSLGETRCAS